MEKSAWCSICRADTVSDIDRCAVCGTRRALSVGPECTCSSQVRNGGQVFKVRNPRCPSHGNVRRLRSV